MQFDLISGKKENFGQNLVGNNIIDIGDATDYLPRNRSVPTKAYELVFESDDLSEVPQEILNASGVSSSLSGGISLSPKALEKIGIPPTHSTLHAKKVEDKSTLFRSVFTGAKSMPAVSKPEISGGYEISVTTLGSSTGHAPVNVRHLLVPPAVRQAIYDYAISALEKIGSVENPLYRLEILKPSYIDKDSFTIEEQKRAILENRTLHRRIRGKVRLIDKSTGKVVDERHMTILSVPYLSDRGSFIINGVSYLPYNQLRLRPGPYGRIKSNGNIEVFVNALPGKGVSQHYELNPETGVISVKIKQAYIPAITLLRAIGVPDEKIKKEWGINIYNANVMAAKDSSIDRAYAAIVGRAPPATNEEKMERIRQKLMENIFDENVTRLTLKKPYKNLTPDAMLDITKKLIRLQLGQEEPDDRDSVAFQYFLGPEDLIYERILNAKNKLNAILYRATFKKDLSFLTPGFLNDSISAYINSSGLVQAASEINPAEIMDNYYKVTSMGAGGIASVKGIPEESRDVRATYFGFIDPVRSPEGEKIGVDMRIASGAFKGASGELYIRVFDLKRKKMAFLPSSKLMDVTVVFPSEFKHGGPVVAAISKGKEKYVSIDEADYALLFMEDAFSALSNLVPMKSAIRPLRISMGSRMSAQALPLVKPEAPLVMSGSPRAMKPYESLYGRHVGAILSDVSGTVVSVDEHKIKVKDNNGKIHTYELYHNFPFNRKTFLHNTPVVSVGQKVNNGTLLAKSNFTDDNGNVALGVNARIAYLPFEGWTYEDSVVISSSMAKKLTSEHMYQYFTPFGADTKVGKDHWMNLFPNSGYSKEQLDKIDKDGVIKPGSVVKKGDPLILSAKEKDVVYGKMIRSGKSSYINATQEWEHSEEGIVTDVVKTDKGATVVVKSRSEAQVGDKISGRYGDKGVIAAIVPDEKMPVDSQGRPFEIIFSPLVVISRANPAQIIEAALGKIAEKTGKPYVIEDFRNIDDLTAFSKEELRKHGLTDKERIYDPVKGRYIDNVMTGNRFIMKLHHTSESKSSGRAMGEYTAEGLPAKGGDNPAQRLGLLEVSGLMSHGAVEFLRSSKLIRGQRNEEWWQAFMSGRMPPDPATPQVFNKFISHMIGAGINVVRRGNKFNLFALTDSDIDRMTAGRQLKNAETVDWKSGPVELKPVKGGLFDEALTGGPLGNLWSYIKLAEPMPNPVMERPIQILLGLTERQFYDVISNKLGFDDKGNIVEADKRNKFDNWYTGTTGILKMLSRIDVNKEIENERSRIKFGKRTVRDHALQRLSILMGIKKTGIRPEKWILTKVPVIPPIFRPVQFMAGTDVQLISDANFLYRDLWEANSALEEVKQTGLSANEERLNLYKAFKAVVGLGEPINPKTVVAKAKGLLDQIFGQSAKFNMLQRKLIGFSLDIVGRAAITPNPELGLDEVALPEETAWEIYKPFIVRALVRQGTGRLEALELIKNKDKKARDALIAQMRSRPVIVSRAPVLHKYGIMAFWPVLTKSNVIQVNPFIVKGFAADFDGDTMGFHVPIRDEEIREAIEKMLPSKNLWSVSRFSVNYVPLTEFAVGLYLATKRAKKKPDVSDEKPKSTYASPSAVRQAYERGELNLDDVVEVFV